MNNEQLSIITLKLEKSALAGQLAGTYKALGYLEEGDRWGRLATVEREAALELTADWPEPPVTDDVTFPFPSVEELSYCCSYNEEPDPDPDLAAPPVISFNSYYLQDRDSDPDLADALAVAREAVVKAALYEEDEPKSPRPTLADLGEGDTIRVFRETFLRGDRTSEVGVVYQHDGSDEGDQPWCETPLGTSNLVPYINSEDIAEWELEQRNPTPVLGELGEGSRIRVFQENAYGETRSSEEGAIYRHDGDDEDYRPWCRVTSHESKDPLTPYLNSSDIIEWEAA